MADQDSDWRVSLQPLSAQLRLNAHDAAPQELKSLFKLHSKPIEGDQEIIIDLHKMVLPGLDGIPPERVKMAFATLLPLPKPEEPETTKVKTATPIDASSDIDDSLESWVMEPGAFGEHGAFGPEGSGSPEADDESLESKGSKDVVESCAALTFKEMPGFVYLPQLLPHAVQIQLLDRLLHEELSNPAHKTNLHAHYDMIYPRDQSSHFGTDPFSTLQPRDPKLHSPLKMEDALNRKLRWMTLGGQYDWTNKIYPTGQPPKFPLDIASFVHHLFPDMEPQAAIVNVYSPGDKLSMHRDVSEEIDQGLVSISLGCSCIFVIGLEDQDTGKIQKLVIRLRSGDALYMTGESRLAWHGVSRVEKDTCPRYLEDWPGEQFKHYKKWIMDKRINLNVRQMRAATMKESDYSTARTADPPS